MKKFLSAILTLLGFQIPTSCIFRVAYGCYTDDVEFKIYGTVTDTEENLVNGAELHIEKDGTFDRKNADGTISHIDTTYLLQKTATTNTEGEYVFKINGLIKPDAKLITVKEGYTPDTTILTDLYGNVIKSKDNDVYHSLYVKKQDVVLKKDLTKNNKD